MISATIFGGPLHGAAPRWIPALLVALLVAVVAPIAPSSPSGASTAIDLGLDAVTGFERDPVTGTLAVAGDDTILLLDAAGAEVATVPDVAGVTELRFDGTDLWAGAEGSPTITRIDTATWTVVSTFDLTAPLRGDLALADGALWAFTSRDPATDPTLLRRLDPATGDVSERGSFANAASAIAAVPGDPTSLLLGVDGLGRYDLTTTPVTRTAGTDLARAPFTVDAAGTRVWATADHGVAELALPDLAHTGVRYRTNGRDGLVHADDAGMLVSAGTGGQLVHLDGRPQASHRLDVASSGVVQDGVVPGGLATTPDAATIYLVVRPLAEGSPPVLVLVTLDTAITEINGPGLWAGTPGAVDVRGRGLGAVEVTVDGEAVDHDVVDDEWVVVSVPPLAAGTYDLEVTGPTGSASTTIRVREVVPGAVHGTISWGYGGGQSEPLPGAVVTIDGPGLAEPLTTVAAGDGRYEILDIPPGDTYVMRVDDPAGTHPSYQIDPLRVGPGDDLWGIDAKLGVVGLGPNPLREIWRLPPGVVRGMAVDPATGRGAVAVGDTVVRLGPDGAPLAEVDDAWAASVPVVEGGVAAVALADSGEVAAIDLTSGAVTRWPVGRPLRSAIAVGSGRAFVTTEDDDAVLAVDLATGAVEDVTPDGAVVVGVAEVPGLDDRIVVHAPDPVLVDSSTAPLSVVATYDDGGEVPVWVDVATDRTWEASGVELVSSTGAPTGIELPHGPEHRSPALGGVLSVGDEVVVQGSTAPTHRRLDDHPAPLRSTAASPDASELTVLFGDVYGLERMTLVPTVTELEPLAPTPQVVLLWGFGLIGATDVRIDGTPVPFTASPQGDALALQAPGFPIGLHELEITTPFGTRTVQLASRPTAPAAPAAPTVEPTAGGAIVSWEPGDDGGAPIERSVVTVQPGDHSCEALGAATTCEVSGLRYGSPSTVSVVAENEVGAGPASPATTFTPLPAPAGYEAIDPIRVLDTRKPTPAPIPEKGSRVITAVAQVIPPDAVGVVLNVTAVSPTADTHLTVWPTGAARPQASNVNLPAGDVRANLVTSAVGADGTVSVFNNAGATHVVADVVGYVIDGGDVLTTTAPTRILDSRQPVSAPTPWTERESRTVVVRGVAGVPDDATGVFLNVTAVAPSAATHLAVSPSGGRPQASNLNLGAGQTRPNLVFTGIGADGSIAVFNNAGSTNVVIDLVGYTTPAEEEGRSVDSRFIGTAPTRVLDSRSGKGGFSTPWGPGAERTVLVRGVAGVPDDATSVVLNLTAIAPTESTHLTVWPSGGLRPTASNLNVPANLTAANLVLAQIGADGRIRIRNNAGSVHLAADVVGYHR